MENKELTWDTLIINQNRKQCLQSMFSTLCSIQSFITDQLESKSINEDTIKQIESVFNSLNEDLQRMKELPE